MAERTVNVTINYKVNTAEVQRAQAASAAAQKATDDLRKATEAYGKASSTAHRAATQGAKDATQSFTGLYNAARLIVTAGVLREVANISIEMSKLAGNTEAVRRAFANQVPNSVALLRELRKATLGTVDDLTLMQKSLKALNFGISVDRLPTLLKFAQIRAQQTGESVDYLVNSIVDGLGRKSILKLDNLGISASRLKDEFNGASLASLSVAQVTEGVANIVDEELVKMGDAIENSATQVDQLGVAWHEFKTEASDSGFWKGVVANLKGMAEAATATLKAMKGESFDEQIKKRQVAEIAAVSANEFMSRRLGKNREENIKILEEEIQHITHQLGLFAKRKESAEALIKTYGRMIRESPYGADTHALRENIDLQRDWIADKEYDAIIDQEILKLLQARLISLQKITEQEVEQSGIIERKREELKTLQDQLEKTNEMGDLGASGKLVLAIKAVQKELDILLGKTEVTGQGVRDYLAYLSEQEMHQTEEVLKDKKEQRERDADREKENAKRSYEHWLYYQDLKKQKEKEYADEAIRIAEDEAARRRELQQQTFQLAEDLLFSITDLLTTNRESEIEGIRNHYDEQIELAGDNERAKKELRIKREREIEAEQQKEKEREKRSATARISIDGLVAIAKIFSQFGWPAGIAPAAIMAGITAANIATVRKYAKGGINIPGPGHDTSDNIPALLSPGESIITAKATRRSMGLLEAIQANKIDDRVLKGIDFSGGRSFSDSRMVEKLGALENELKGIRKSQYRLEEQAGILYRVHEDDAGNRKRIRSRLGL